MANFRVIAEAPATRCDICHQADCFDAATGKCSRCSGIDTSREARSGPGRRAVGKSGWSAIGWALLLAFPVFLIGMSAWGALIPKLRISRPPALPLSLSSDPSSLNPLFVEKVKIGTGRDAVRIHRKPEGGLLEIVIPPNVPVARRKIHRIHGLITGGDFISGSTGQVPGWRLIVHDDKRNRQWIELPPQLFQELTGQDRVILDEGLLVGNRVTIEFHEVISERRNLITRLRLEGRDLKRVAEMYGGTDPGSFLRSFNAWATLGVTHKEDRSLLFSNLSCGFYDCPRLKVSGIVGERCREQGMSGRGGFFLKTEGNRKVRMVYDMSEIFLSTQDTAELSRQVIPGKYVTVEARTLPNGSNIVETIEILEAAGK